MSTIFFIEIEVYKYKIYEFRMVIAPWKNEKNKSEDGFGYYRAWIRSIQGSSFCFLLNKL